MLEIDRRLSNLEVDYFNADQVAKRKTSESSTQSPPIPETFYRKLDNFSPKSQDLVQFQVNSFPKSGIVRDSSLGSYQSNSMLSFTPPFANSPKASVPVSPLVPFFLEEHTLSGDLFSIDEKMNPIDLPFKPYLYPVLQSLIIGC
jgi:hypothetical protein